jgi:pimeloyl-ACP methyl ester carboxylesterase
MEQLASLHERLKRREVLVNKTSYNYYFRASEKSKKINDGSKYKVMHFSHGFGANALCWEPLMSYLIDTEEVDMVCAHDTAGFGQTKAPRLLDVPNDQFTLEYNGRHATMSVIEQACACDEVLVSSGSVDIVLVGHSMGCISALCSADTWLSRGFHCPAVVLVAPAINLSSQCNRFDCAATVMIRSIFFLLAMIRLLGAIGIALIRLWLYVVVNTHGFWNLGLWLAYSCELVPPDKTVSQYSSAALRQGWTVGLTDFMEANLWNRSHRQSDESSDATVLMDIFLRLHNAGTDILIVHDDRDPLVNVRNSDKLMRCLRTAFAENKKERHSQTTGRLLLEVVRGSGHMPHHATAESFVDILRSHCVAVQDKGAR